jgi:tetratricopeptide (TPR) repeat protein
VTPRNPSAGPRPTAATTDAGLAPLATWADGDVILNEFVIERKLGQGGMGVVSLVRSRANGWRFAVKRALVHDDNKRRQFLTELVTWQDLPEHPFLAPFRFFRTVGDEVVIFTEFVDGGTLADWIKAGRLTRLGDMLDVAIQFAWGLHVAHEAGMIHRDVKPHNALMTADGQLKVTDFGLARCRLVAGEEAAESIVVSSGGRTPAYASPEQTTGRELSRKTDIWSWAVSVLDVFVGRVPSCRSGTVAPQVLEGYLASGPLNSGLPRMPQPLADVLRRCFQHSPADRCTDLGEVLETLVPLYRTTTGRLYPRPLFVADRSAATVARHDRRDGTGGRWSDPREWLVKALKAAGRDPSEADSLVPPGAVSRRAQVTADVAVLDAAQRIYRRLLASGRVDLLGEIAALTLAKGHALAAADDQPGAAEAFDLALTYRRRLADHEADGEPAAELARGLMHKGNLLRVRGDLRGALGAYDEAVAIRRRLVGQQNTDAQVGDLAVALSNKASASQLLGDLPGAMQAYDEAITAYRRLIKRWENPEIVGNLAAALICRAVALRSRGNPRGAVGACDEAIGLLRGLTGGAGRGCVGNDIADALMNKGNALSELGDLRGAVSAFDEAIAIRRRLVEKGRAELVNGIAAALVNKGNALSELGDLRGAVGAYDEAIAIRRRLVEKEGRADLAGDLARLRLLRAVALLKLGERAVAQREARDAMPLLRQEVKRTRRADLQRALDWSNTALKNVL